MAGTAALVTLDGAALQELAAAKGKAYRSADPFPHAVLDDFLPGEIAAQAAVEFAGLSQDGWVFYEDGGNTLKLATNDLAHMGPLLRQLVAEFNGKAMIDFLESLTGIAGLVPDPHLLGGGLHQLNPGGFLRVHADFNEHPQLRLDRRVNVLLYLNPDWQEQWGGALELWNQDMSERVVNAPPLLNRVVIFNTTSTAYHGNPEPVSCPPGNARRSLAFYYYTNGRPEEERAGRHNTLYQTPGTAPVVAPEAPASESWLRRLGRDLAPPLFARAARRLRRRAS